MNLERVAVWILWFIALYPPVTAAFWVAGGLIFRFADEKNDAESPSGGWPPLTLLIPAYNEGLVIGTAIEAARHLDYPALEILVLDDGSTDDTVVASRRAAEGDRRIRVVEDSVNRGKAERLNRGFAIASSDLVLVCDADTHMHPVAPKLLVNRLARSPLNAAVAAAPHVTNRTNLLCAMQVLEAASIIGLIRRTGSLRGRVGTVAGVLALFRREVVISVGGYRGEMATEDIDLTWRMLLAGWHAVYEPEALIGMQVPTSLKALWAQRRRWARGQGEVLHEHLGALLSWSRRGMWPLALESVGSLLWVVAWALALLLATIDLFVPSWHTIFGLTIAWGVAIAVVCLVQLAFALLIDSRYDSNSLRAFLLGPIYPIFFWLIAACAALRTEIPAVFTGPAEHRVVWDIPRDPADTSPT